MTYYTPPEVRREIEQFSVVMSNPPFNADYGLGRKTHPVKALIDRLCSILRAVH